MFLTPQYDQAQPLLYGYSSLSVVCALQSILRALIPSVVTLPHLFKKWMFNIGTIDSVMKYTAQSFRSCQKNIWKWRWSDCLSLQGVLYACALLFTRVGCFVKRGAVYVHLRRALTIDVKRKKSTWIVLICHCRLSTRAPRQPSAGKLLLTCKRVPRP